ncbi:MAG: hypothetical protein IT244_01300 [Bacteroidia bacterium]|nr:hypothetical protein [Bacteroidia bacterium]
MKHIPILLFTILAMQACKQRGHDEKGFQVGPANTADAEPTPNDGVNLDSFVIKTRPADVLLTAWPQVRLTPLFKVNTNKDNNRTFTGESNFYRSYEGEDGPTPGNNYHHHLLPGFEAVYGYNLVNISFTQLQEGKPKNLFAKPVLVKTLYYPAPEQDTLNRVPVNRNFMMVSVYNQDTNKDGFINLKDLRRLYGFNAAGDMQKALVPENCSVYKSQYDPINDYMYVYTRLDSNNNGQHDSEEPIQIYWVDLKDPSKTGRVY